MNLVKSFDKMLLSNDEIQEQADGMPKDKLYIDFCGNKMKYVQGHYEKANKTLQISKYGVVEFPEDSLSIFESEYSIKFLKNLLVKEDISTKIVYINITNPATVIRLIKIPKMSNKLIQNYLHIELPQYLSSDLSSNVYDYKILEEFEEDGKKFQNIMVTAIPKNIVATYLKRFKEVGLTTKVVDVFANSIARLFGTLDKRDIAVANICNNYFIFTVLKSGTLFVHANILIENTIYIQNIDETVEHMMTHSSNFQEYMREILNNFRTYLEFFSSRHFGKNVDIIYLIGEITKLENISDFLSKALNIKVTTSLPSSLDLIDTNNQVGSITHSKDENNILSFAANIGLMLRDMQSF